MERMYPGPHYYYCPLSLSLSVLNLKGEDGISFSTCMLFDTCIPWTCTDPNCLHFTYIWVSAPHFTVLNIPSSGSPVSFQSICVYPGPHYYYCPLSLLLSVLKGEDDISFSVCMLPDTCIPCTYPRLHFTHTWVSTLHFTVLTIPNSGSPVSFQDYQNSELLTTFVWWEEVQ